MSASRFDVLVLGGGTAGCVLAGRLSENPDCAVCLVEAGPDYGHFSNGAWPTKVVDALWRPFSHPWASDRADRSAFRSRILGGCSTQNGCVMLEGSRHDYDEWGDGWTYDEFLPYLRRARETFRTRPPVEEMLSPWHRAFVEVGGAASILLSVNEVDGVRWNAAFAYIDPARSRPNLTIVANTLVERILFDRQRARGALTSAGALHADTVVVASGAYGTPGILLRSGISPETGLPAGERLRDHSGVGFRLEATERLQSEMRTFAAKRPRFIEQVALRLQSSTSPDDHWDIFVFPWLESDLSISAAVVAYKPRSTGAVRLSGPDAETPLAIDNGFLSDPRDAEVLAEGIEMFRELLATAPIKCYATREKIPGAHIRSGLYARAGVRSFLHPVGTCPIGSVVGPDGAVLGYDALFVADASIMPTIPRANPHLTIAGIAERIAELIQTRRPPSSATGQLDEYDRRRGIAEEIKT